MSSRLFRRAVAWIAGIAMVAGTSALAQSQTDLWSFGSLYGSQDQQRSAPVVDANGNLFGSTDNGGANGLGYVWEYTAGGQFLDLHDFVGSDGEYPLGSLAVDTQGNIYGTTQGGGNNGAGVVYEVQVGGNFLVLASMDPTNVGQDPAGGVVIDRNGNLYGVDNYGASSDPNSGGSLWWIPNGGTLQSLTQFEYNGIAGSNPTGAYIAVDASGNVYGFNQYDEIYNGGGVIWKWNSANGLSLIYALQQTDRGFPSSASGVTVDSSGDVYVIFAGGGANSFGRLEEFYVGGGQADLYDFAEQDGQFIFPSRVAADATGNVYGISPGDFSDNFGSAWKVDPSGNFSTLFSFANASGRGYLPLDAPVVGSRGYLYGVTRAGGASGIGTLWSFALFSPVTSLTLSPSTVVGGNGATGTVTIGTAQSSDTQIQLTWQPGAATAPTTVTVPAGQTTASFPITTSPVATLENITFGAFGQGYRNFKLATITITAPTVTGLTLSPTTVSGGTSSTGTVTLTSPAPAGGLPVTLVSEYAFASVPASFTIPAGQTSGNFTITTSAVKTTSTDVIAALSGSSRAVASLTVTAPTVSGLTLSPSKVTGGQADQGTVTLTSPAPAGGLTVTLTSEYASVSVPASVTIPSGQTAGTFNLTTNPVSSQAVATIVATYASSHAVASLTVAPPSLVSLTTGVSSLVGGNSTQGTVSIGSAAPTGGLVIALLSSSGTVTVPSSVTIPAGATSVNFTVSTKTVTTTQSATIKASSNGQAVTTPLTLTHS